MRDRFTLSSTDGSLKLPESELLCKSYIMSNFKTYKMSNGIIVTFDIDIPEGREESDVVKPIDFTHDPEKTYSDTFKFCNLRALDSYNSLTQNSYRYRAQSSDEDNTQYLNHIHVENMEAWGGEVPMTITLDFTEAGYTTGVSAEIEENELYPLVSRSYYEGDAVTIYIMAVTDSLAVSGLTDYLVEPAPYIYNTFNNVDWNNYIYVNGGFDTYTNYKEFKFNTPDFNHSQKYSNGMSQYGFNQSTPSLPFYHRYSDKSGIMTFDGNTVDNTVRYTLIKITGRLTAERKVKLSNVKRDSLSVDTVSAGTQTVIPASKLANGRINCIKARCSLYDPE